MGGGVVGWWYYIVYRTQHASIVALSATTAMPTSPLADWPPEARDCRQPRRYSAECPSPEGGNSKSHTTAAPGSRPGPSPQRRRVAEPGGLCPGPCLSSASHLDLGCR